MDNTATHYYLKMPDENFSVDIMKRYAHGPQKPVGLHWHEHLQLYYIIDGKASLVCNSSRIDAGPGNFIVVNANEVHTSLNSLSDDLLYYILRIEPSFIFSNQVDICQAKYIAPLTQNLICFHNFIENDPQVISCVKKAIEEYGEKRIGYELEIKASVYHLLVLLLRGYIDRIFTQEEFDSRITKMKSLTHIFQYIEKNYAEKITAHGLARIANLSLSHFCRIFKQVAGKTLTDYVNDFRLSKAVLLLSESKQNITEIALACGFYDANYFSRIFKMRVGTSPVEFRKRQNIV